MVALLRRRNFALVWFAGLISMIGDRALLTALPFFVYQQTGSTLATAGMFAAFYLPMVLFGSVAGVFVDRWNRQRLMVYANLLQAAALLLLLLVDTTVWLWLVYVVFFVETSLAMFVQPAENALLPQLVEREELVAANGLNALNDNIARLVGPPVGGLLLALFGLWGVAIVDCVSFLVAAALLALMKNAPPGPMRAAQPSQTPWSALAVLRSEWLDGMRFIRETPIVRALVAVVGITSFGGCMFDPLIAPWVGSVLGGGADFLGWLSTAGAVGGLIGGMLLGRYGRRIAPLLLLGGGNILAGLLLLAMYNSSMQPAVLVLALVKSVPLVASGAGLTTLFQLNVAETHAGRVFGALNTTNAILGLLALAVAGFGAQLVGIVPMVSVAAGLTVFAGAMALLLLSRHTAQPPGGSLEPAVSE